MEGYIQACLEYLHDTWYSDCSMNQGKQNDDSWYQLQTQTNVLVQYREEKLEKNQ